MKSRAAGGTRQPTTLGVAPVPNVAPGLSPACADLKVGSTARLGRHPGPQPVDTTPGFEIDSRLQTAQKSGRPPDHGQTVRQLSVSAPRIRFHRGGKNIAERERARSRVWCVARKGSPPTCRLRNRPGNPRMALWRRGTFDAWREKLPSSQVRPAASAVVSRYD